MPTQVVDEGVVRHSTSCMEPPSRHIEDSQFGSAPRFGRCDCHEMTRGRHAQSERSTFPRHDLPQQSVRHRTRLVRLSCVVGRQFHQLRGGRGGGNGIGGVFQGLVRIASECRVVLARKDRRRRSRYAAQEAAVERTGVHIGKSGALHEDAARVQQPGLGGLQRDLEHGVARPARSLSRGAAAGERAQGRGQEAGLVVEGGAAAELGVHLGPADVLLLLLCSHGIMTTP
mmetsp:Transcript_168748/g.542326  ORF Transcript_168748/g.542326 Transcript_168748/m.542326 type:complete len:229 (+) Transcript_168748:1666-2352(+)